MDASQLRLILIAALCVSTGFSGGEPESHGAASAEAPLELTPPAPEEVPERLPAYSAPRDQLRLYLNGFQFACGSPDDQLETHHYCSRLTADVMQCVIFDGHSEEARIIGVEYIISARLFRTLPDEEKQLWHSHAYSVKAGDWVAPGLSAEEEHEVMRELVATYGKTFLTWHSIREPNLPTGIPSLLMDFTKPGQVHPHLIEERDEHFDLSTTEKRRTRRDIRAPAIARGANAWERGTVPQLILAAPADSLATR